MGGDTSFLSHCNSANNLEMNPFNEFSIANVSWTDN